jgi:hypothetical protein
MRVPSGIAVPAFDLLGPVPEGVKKVECFVRGQLDPGGPKLVAPRAIGSPVIDTWHRRMMPNRSGDIPGHWPTRPVPQERSAAASIASLSLDGSRS